MSVPTNQPIPLCVDLDGTLLRTDMLLESILLLLKQQPISVLLIPLWLLKGKSHLKTQLAKKVDVNNKSFPYNPDVVSFIKSQSTQRDIVLVTGTHIDIANKINQDCRLFNVVEGTTEQTNLVGGNKLRWLMDNYGEKGFDYIGNDKADLKIWPHARLALAVSTPNGIHKSIPNVSHVFSTKATGATSFLKLLRVHQWSKNCLIFVPYLLDQRIGDPTVFPHLLFAFFAMCFLASATYILNDMLDIHADRNHKTKSARMMASGDVSILTGFIALLAASFLCLIFSYFLNIEARIALLLYLVVTLLYSFRLKSIILLDVTIIAALHSLRVVVGTVAIAAVWSFWLLAFSMFVFFSLALAKRVAELNNLLREGRLKATGRGYLTTDLPVLLATGVSTAYISILVVALYINSDKVLQMYERPQLLWLICPALAYWVGRIWIKAWRGQLDEDPIIFALKDRVSLLVLLFVVTILALANIAA